MPILRRCGSFPVRSGPRLSFAILKSAIYMRPRMPFFSQPVGTMIRLTTNGTGRSPIPCNYRRPCGSALCRVLTRCCDTPLCSSLAWFHRTLLPVKDTADHWQALVTQGYAVGLSWGEGSSPCSQPFGIGTTDKTVETLSFIRV